MSIGLHVKHPLYLSDHSETWIFSKIYEKYSKSNFMKIRPAGVEFNADDRTHTHTHMTQLTVALHNRFANAPKRPILHVRTNLWGFWQPLTAWTPGWRERLSWRRDRASRGHHRRYPAWVGSPPDRGQHWSSCTSRGCWASGENAGLAAGAPTWPAHPHRPSAAHSLGAATQTKQRHITTSFRQTTSSDEVNTTSSYDFHT